MAGHEMSPSPLPRSLRLKPLIVIDVFALLISAAGQKADRPDRSVARSEPRLADEPGPLCVVLPHD